MPNDIFAKLAAEYEASTRKPSRSREGHSLTTPFQQDLASDLESRGFTVTSATRPNDRGSRHASGAALDIRTKDKPSEVVDVLKAELEGRGLRVLDERYVKTPKRTGPHLHVSTDDALSRELKRQQQPKPKPQPQQPQKDVFATLADEYEKGIAPPPAQPAQQLPPQSAPQFDFKQRKPGQRFDFSNSTKADAAKLQVNKPVSRPRAAFDANVNRKPVAGEIVVRQPDGTVAPTQNEPGVLERVTRGALNLSPVGLVAKALGKDYGGAVVEGAKDIPRQVEEFSSLPGDWSNIGIEAAKGFRKAVRSAPQAAATLLDIPIRTATRMLPNDPYGAKKTIEANLPLAERLQGWTQAQNAETDRIYQEQYGIDPNAKTKSSVIGGSFGQSIPLLVGGAAGLGAKGVAAIGAGMNAQQAYAEARAKGATPEEASRAATIAAPIGALEGMFGAEAQLAKAGVSRTMARKAAEVLRNAPAEVGQEVLTEALNNINKAYVSGYAPDTRVTDGIVEAAIGSLGMTGAIGGTGLAARGVNRAANAFNVDAGPIQGAITEALAPDTAAAQQRAVRSAVEQDTRDTIDRIADQVFAEPRRATATPQQDVSAQQVTQSVADKQEQSKNPQTADLLSSLDKTLGTAKLPATAAAVSPQPSAPVATPATKRKTASPVTAPPPVENTAPLTPQERQQFHLLGRMTDEEIDAIPPQVARKLLPQQEPIAAAPKPQTPEEVAYARRLQRLEGKVSPEMLSVTPEQYDAQLAKMEERKSAPEPAPKPEPLTPEEVAYLKQVDALTQKAPEAKFDVTPKQYRTQLSKLEASDKAMTPREQEELYGLQLRDLERTAIPEPLPKRYVARGSRTAPPPAVELGNGERASITNQRNLNEISEPVTTGRGSGKRPDSVQRGNGSLRGAFAGDIANAQQPTLDEELAAFDAAQGERVVNGNRQSPPTLGRDNQIVPKVPSQRASAPIAGNRLDATPAREGAQSTPPPRTTRSTAPSVPPQEQVAPKSRKPLRRNFRAGVNNAEIVFESDLHRDLYDVGANSRTVQNKTSDRARRDDDDIVSSIAQQLGKTPAEVRILGREVLDDTRAQMKGVKDSETRTVKLNLPKQPNDTPRTSRSNAAPDGSATAGVQETAAREPWQMTREQYFSDEVRVRSDLGGTQSSGYQIQYDYVDPSPAGPNRGSMTVDRPYGRGEIIAAPFGSAKVTSTSPRKSPPVSLASRFDEAKALHRRAVEQALAEGKPVPAEVLADYPDLAPQSSDTDRRQQSEAQAQASTAAKNQSPAMSEPQQRTRTQEIYDLDEHPAFADIDRRVAARGEKGTMGQFHRFGMQRGTGETSLLANPELREMLNLPPMPEQDSKGYAEAAAHTADALAEVVGVSRSSQADAQALAKAEQWLIAQGASDELYASFVAAKALANGTTTNLKALLDDPRVAEPLGKVLADIDAGQKPNTRGLRAILNTVANEINTKANPNEIITDGALSKFITNLNKGSLDGENAGTLARLARTKRSGTDTRETAAQPQPESTPTQSTESAASPPDRQSDTQQPSPVREPAAAESKSEQVKPPTSKEAANAPLSKREPKNPEPELDWSSVDKPKPKPAAPSPVSEKVEARGKDAPIAEQVIRSSPFETSKGEAKAQAKAALDAVGIKARYADHGEKVRVVLTQGERADVGEKVQDALNKAGFTGPDGSPLSKHTWNGKVEIVAYKPGVFRRQGDVVQNPQPLPVMQPKRSKSLDEAETVEKMSRVSPREQKRREDFKAQVEKEYANLTPEEARREFSKVEEPYLGPFGSREMVNPTSQKWVDDHIRMEFLRTKSGSKEFWQRTQAQVKSATGMPAFQHRKRVEQALAEGKTVPPEVLADYPDLATKSPGSTTSFLGTGAFAKFNEADITTIAQHFVQHAKDAAAWGRAMVRSFGEQVRPRLRQIWQALQTFYKDERGVLDEKAVIEGIKNLIQGGKDTLLPHPFAAGLFIRKPRANEKFLRLGDLPAQSSRNYRDGVTEPGVSVYGVIRQNGEDRVFGAGGFTYFDNRPTYEVTGDVVVDKQGEMVTGSDGEPLLVNAKITRKSKVKLTDFPLAGKEASKETRSAAMEVEKILGTRSPYRWEDSVDSKQNAASIRLFNENKKVADLLLSRGWQQVSSVQFEWGQSKIIDGIKNLAKKAGFESNADYAARKRAEMENSPEFRKWFGDSEVVDKNGKPLVLYHGTSADGDFASFQKKARGASGMPLAKRAFFFAESSKDAGMYGSFEKGRVMPVYVAIENAYEMPIDEFRKFEDGTYGDSRASRLIADLRAQGYDGIHVSDAGVWAALEPTQIKSAFNRGTFDPLDPNISNAGIPINAMLGAAKKAGSATVKSVRKPFETSGFNDSSVRPDYDFAKYTEDLKNAVKKSTKENRMKLAPEDYNLLARMLPERIFGRFSAEGAAKRTAQQFSKHFADAVDAFNNGDSAKLVEAQRELAIVVQAPKHKILADLFRPLMLSAELSFVGIQGGVNLMSHPVRTYRAAMLGLKAASPSPDVKRFFDNLIENPKAAISHLIFNDSTPMYGKVVQAVRNHHRTALGKKAGLELDTLADLDPTVSIHEKTEGFAVTGIRKLPLWRQTERFGRAFGDALRLQAFDQSAKLLEAKGLTFEKNPEQFKEAARVANIFSGRGDFGRFQGAAHALSYLGTSPRLVVSQFQILNPMEFARVYKSDPLVLKAGLKGKARVVDIADAVWNQPLLVKERAKDITKIAAFSGALIGLALAAGWDIPTDPDDPKYLMAKRPGSDFAIGIVPSSLRPQIKYLHRLWKNFGELEHRGLTGMLSEDMRDTVNYLSNKTAPIPSLIKEQATEYRKNRYADPLPADVEAKGRPDNLAKGTLRKLSPAAYEWLDKKMRFGYGSDFIGRPVTLMDSVTSRMNPIYFNTLYEAWQNEFLTTGEKTARSVSEFFGHATSDVVSKYQPIKLPAPMEAEFKKHRANLGYISQEEGESRKNWEARAERVQRLLTEHLPKLTASERYQKADEATRKKALESLKRRVADFETGAANQKVPVLRRLSPAAIFEDIKTAQKSQATQKARIRRNAISAVE